ncbi:MAG: phosphoribosylamine--glycine ligase [Planctomycetota bacterium]
MNVLVVGNGGREHALAWKLAQSPRADRVFVAPGNAGTALDAENVDIPATDIERLIKFSKENSVGLAVIGPEVPLAAGIVDAFNDEKLKAFGPTKAAAQLEASKSFCKEMMHHADIPTADYQVFHSAATATRFISDRYPEDADYVPQVIKADGLAAGKGVMVCDTRDEALDAIKQLTDPSQFGDSGSSLIIEEKLVGQEASILAITDGRSILPLPVAQDHKPAFDGDKGPNTGGMGAYCPAPIVDEELMQSVQERILVPIVHAMKRKRSPFRGVLYAGIMVTNQGPKVLEFNVRFGDPECQPVLMRLQSDLLDIVEATVDGTLDELPPLQWDPRPSVCVVMASEGYPGSYERGKPIRGLDDAATLPGVKVFHAGTASLDDQVVTNGGRVLGITAMGNSIATAKLQAYKAVKCIRWDGAWCRKDISDKANPFA